MTGCRALGRAGFGLATAALLGCGDGDSEPAVDRTEILAVERGVRPHHWRFGSMPPVPGVSREEIEEVTAYVRWLQRQAGIE